MLVEGICYAFVGSFEMIVKFYGAVWVCVGLSFVIQGFNGVPVDILVLFMVPVAVYMIFPNFLFMICDFSVYFNIKCGEVLVVWICISDLVALLDFVYVI